MLWKSHNTSSSIRSPQIINRKTKTQKMLIERERQVAENIRKGTGSAVRPTAEEYYNPDILLEILKL